MKQTLLSLCLLIGVVLMVCRLTKKPEPKPEVDYVNDWLKNRQYGKISKSDQDSLYLHKDHNQQVHQTLMGCSIAPEEKEDCIILKDPDCNGKSVRCDCGWRYYYKEETITDTIYKTAENEEKVKAFLRYRHAYMVFYGRASGDTTIIDFDKSYTWDKNKMTYIKVTPHE